MTYHPIKTQADIDHFLDRTNGLHDAYLIGVHYAHNGISGGNPCFIDPESTELTLRWLVTSIYDAVVELTFTGLLEWQLRDAGMDITDTALSFTDKGFVLWTDAPEFRESDSYVMAQAMKWRFLDVTP